MPNFVTDRVAQCVVHLPETVAVNKQHRELKFRVTGGASQGLRDQLTGHLAVRHLGQAVDA